MAVLPSWVVDLLFFGIGISKPSPRPTAGLGVRLLDGEELRRRLPRLLSLAPRGCCCACGDTDEDEVDVDVARLCERTYSENDPSGVVLFFFFACSGR